MKIFVSLNNHLFLFSSQVDESSLTVYSENLILECIAIVYVCVWSLPSKAVSPFIFL